MNNLIMLVILSIATSIFMSGCSQKAPQATILENPHSPSDEVPKWVFSQNKNQAVGSALATPYGFSHQKDEAVMMARAELASSMKSNVEQIIKNFYETSRIEEDTKRRALTSTATRLVTNMVLVNSYISDIWISETNEMFVLISVDNQDFEGSVHKALKDSSNKGFKELDKHLKKEIKAEVTSQSYIKVEKESETEEAIIPLLNYKKRTYSNIKPSSEEIIEKN